MDNNVFTKNRILTAEVESFASDGSGVCRVDGRAIFVKGALPGEKWEIKLTKVTPAAVWAIGLCRLNDAPERCAPLCPVYGKCGGCATLHMTYEAELRFKLERVNEALRRIGGTDFRITEILGSAHTEGYRNKSILNVAAGADGPVAGFYRPRSHDVVPAENCLIQSELSARVVRAVLDWMQKNGVAPYNEENGKGQVRHIFTRCAFRTGEAMACIVTARGFGGVNNAALVEALRTACPEIKSIVLCINKSRGNSVLDGDFHTLWGSDTITEELCGLRFELSPRSFFQINPPQAEKLYAKALEYASPDGAGTVLDLYCGAGTISLCLARGAKQVIGAEIVPEAVEDARRSAVRNGIENVRFICGDASEAAVQLQRAGVKPDAVVVDPPRKGLTPEVIRAVAEMAPARVAYVSCDPATLARDVRLFADYGYHPTAGCAVDMFTHTSHIETVVLLSKLCPEERKVEITLNLADIDLTKAESKATYEQIQEYVYDKYGFKVSHLYVAQVKRKHFIIERENYNLPKTDGNRVPECPEEKVLAIEDALRHFKMI